MKNKQTENRWMRNKWKNKWTKNKETYKKWMRNK